MRPRSSGSQPDRGSRQTPTADTTRPSPDYWRFLTGQTISSLGSSFTVFALPLLVYQLTGSALNLAVSTAVNLAPYLLFGLVLGAWADRVNRRRLMLLVDVARAALVASIPVADAGHHLTVLWVYAVGFLASTLGIAFESAQFAAVPSLVGQQDLVRANGQMQAGYSAATVLGPLLAGAMLTVSPVSDTLLVDAGSFLVSAALLARIRTPFNAPAKPRETTIREEVREGLRFIWDQPILRLIALMMMPVNFVAASVGAQVVFFATRVLHATGSQIGLLYSAGSVGIVVLSLAAGVLRTRLGFGRVALGSLAVQGLIVVVFALTRNVWVAMPEWALVNGLGVLFNINTGSLRQTIVPDRMLGRVAATSKVLAWGVMPFGALLGGAVISATGKVALVYVVLGALTAAIALGFALTALGRVERQRAAAPQAASPATTPTT